jgi:GAF domain-containing protein
LGYPTFPGLDLSADLKGPYGPILKLKVKKKIPLILRTFVRYFLCMDELKKEGRYQRIISQLRGLLTKTDDPVARMATISAVLSHKFDYFFWCGFYFVQGDIMVVGPYQGPVACQVLKGTGVCIESVRQDTSLVVPDVHNFPGHIACDSRSNSEIVVPVRGADGNTMAVLDVDSAGFGSFDETDRLHLEIIASLVYTIPKTEM